MYNKIPEAWRHLEPAVTRFGNVRNYYLHCQRCFKPKGHTRTKICLECRRKEPRGGLIEIKCPQGHMLHRNDVITSLYMAGVSSIDIGRCFRLSANQILSIAKKSQAGMAEW